jgi:hypothetical protein
VKVKHVGFTVIKKTIEDATIHRNLARIDTAGWDMRGTKMLNDRNKKKKKNNVKNDMGGPMEKKTHSRRQ